MSQDPAAGDPGEAKAAARAGQAVKRKLGTQDDNSPQPLKRAKLDSQFTDADPAAFCQFFVIIDGKTKVHEEFVESFSITTIGDVVARFFSKPADVFAMLNGKVVSKDKTLRDAGVVRDCSLHLRPRIAADSPDLRATKAFLLAFEHDPAKVAQLAPGSVLSFRMLRGFQHLFQLVDDDEDRLFAFKSVLKEPGFLLECLRAFSEQRSDEELDQYSAELILEAVAEKPALIEHNGDADELASMVDFVAQLWRRDSPPKRLCQGLLTAIAKRVNCFDAPRDLLLHCWLEEDCDNRLVESWRPENFASVFEALIGQIQEFVTLALDQLARAVQPHPSAAAAAATPQSTPCEYASLRAKFEFKKNVPRTPEGCVQLLPSLEHAISVLDGACKLAPAGKRHLAELSPSVQQQAYRPFSVLLDRCSACLDAVSSLVRTEFVLNGADPSAAESTNLRAKALRLLNPLLCRLHAFFKAFDELPKFSTMLCSHRWLLEVMLRPAYKFTELKFLESMPECIPYSAKVAILRRQLPEPVADARRKLKLNVDRKMVLEQSLSLHKQIKSKLEKGLIVTFKNEEGKGPGVLREWFKVVCDQLFNPNYALWKPLPTNPRLFAPNPDSHLNSSHLEYFRFSGMFYALALINNVQLENGVAGYVFRHMMKKDFDWADLKTYDADLHKSLTSLLESKLGGGPERKEAKEGKASDSPVGSAAATAKSMSLGGSGSGPQPMSLGADGDDEDDDMSLRFEMPLGEVGNEVMRELVPGGSKKRVTDGNKHEYVREMARMRMIGSVEKQIKYFTEGFSLLIDPQWLTAFSDAELQRLVCGLPDVDAKDWKAHAVYKGGFSVQDDTIKWFWSFVETITPQQRSDLLYFATSIARLPAGGFAALSSPFAIRLDPVAGADRLPSSHTCFLELVLPRFSSQAALARALLTHVLGAKETVHGFGMV